MSHHPADPSEPGSEFDSTTPASPRSDDAEPTARGARLRDPGDRRAAGLAWALLALLLALLVGMQWAGPGQQPAAATGQTPPPAGPVLLMGRYAVGATEMTRRFAGDQQARQMAGQMLSQLDQMTDRPADRLRVAMLAAELAGAEQALERLDALLDEQSGDQSDQGNELSESLRTDAQRLKEVFTAGPEAISSDARDALLDRHGWFSEVALSVGEPSGSPARKRALAPGRRMVFAAMGGFGLAVFGFLAGLVLLALAAVRAGRGGMPMRYAPPAPGGSAYLETFTLYIASFLVLQVIVGVIATQTGLGGGQWLLWALLLTALWPMSRGADVRAWKYALGWHSGRGVVREIGAGIVGYIAGLPILAVGVALVFILSAVVSVFTGGAGEPPSHPIVQEIGAGGVWGAINLYLLACVLAPILEETMFRGALFHHLRGRLGVIAAGLLTALIFAVIHPQGIIAVPALMSLALVFALLREWRGSLIAPITAHAINNAAVVTLLVVAMS